MARNFLFLVLMCASTTTIYSTISTVYNLRIAETTKLDPSERQATQGSMTALTVFNQWRTSRRFTEQNIGGGMVSLTYIPSALYTRVDFAIANVYDDATHFTRTQSDDLLFSTGYGITLNDQTKITFSGLLGLPTHTDCSLDHIQFGYGHTGLGLQVDGACVYSANRHHTLRSAARCIYFMPQTVTALNDNGCHQNFRFGNGVLTDLFIAHTSSIDNHKVEFGYNPTFLYGTALSPSMKDTLAKSQYTRNNFYGTYRYSFSLKKIKSSVAVALSYGFDSSSKLFGYKRILNTWASWGIDF